MNHPTSNPLELRNVTLSFDGGHPVLLEVSLAIRPGEFVGIIGAPGSGKSSLLNLMAGVIPHYQPGTIEGQALVFGRDTRELSLPEIATHVGMVTQDPENQLFNLLVEDEVVWAMENRGYARDVMEDRLGETLAFFDIVALRNRITYDLSGGEKQRVALAATHICHLDILMLDSPTSQLDPVGASMVIESIRKILREHQTVIMVEDKIDELLEHADRLIVLHRGQVALDVPPAELGEHVELFHDIGMRLPEVVELTHRLRKSGVAFPRMPVDLGDAVDLYRDLLNSDRPNASRAPTEDLPGDDDRSHLVLSDVSFTYPPPRTINAVKNVSLSVPRASFVAIIGKNGSGKTTLARCISGYLKPSQGRVSISGREVHQLKLQERVQRVGYVFQNPDHQIFKDSVRTDVEFGLENLGWERSAIDARVDHVLDMLRLRQFEEMHPYRLSKGNRQRLAIAAIAAMKPDVLIIDEPTTGQDPHHAREVMELLQSLQSEGVTIIVVTHAMNLVGEYCDRVIALSEGAVLIDGAPHDVFASGDVLQVTSVEPPPVAQLALRLGVSPPPLTMDDATSLFTALLQHDDGRESR